jgi:hypothetical protein
MTREPLDYEEQRRALILMHDTLIRLDSIKTDFRHLSQEDRYNLKLAKEELGKFVEETYATNKPIS